MGSAAGNRRRLLRFRQGHLLLFTRNKVRKVRGKSQLPIAQLARNHQRLERRDIGKNEICAFFWVSPHTSDLHSTRAIKYSSDNEL